MSTTITIENNTQHAMANEKAVKVVQTCGCVSDQGTPYGNCSVCNGSGEDFHYLLPHTLTLTEKQFKSVWAALGFDLQWDGEVWPNRMVAALVRVAITPIGVIDEDRVANHWKDYGIDGDDAIKWWRRLREIAVEASQREERITWN